MDLRTIVTEYFWEGFRYGSIIRMLHEYHGVTISRRTLFRRLRDYGLQRRHQSCSMADVFNAIQQERRGTGALCGYRSMWQRLRQHHGIVTTHAVVRNILRQIDPISVASRRRRRLRRRTYVSRGPNDTWHIDGYDKLRPYGILISGCIDGFSRKILWLRASFTNHNPGLVAHYFVDCISRLGGYPDNTRTDCGSENGVIAAIQTLLTGNARSHTYGTSPGNQRIEAWWSFFRRSRSQWWIDLFESIVARGVFTCGNWQQVELLRFCFMDLVQLDLDDVAHLWNTHRIRPSNLARCPPGVPDELFYIPPAPFINVLHCVTAPLPPAAVASLVLPRRCESELFEEYLQYLMNFHNLVMPAEVSEAVDLYCRLVRFLN